MNVTIRQLGVELNSEEREWLRRRLQFALARWADRIDQVIAYLGDENGPRGGDDKTCRLLIFLPRTGRLTVHEQGADLRDIVSRAADSLAQTIDRRLKRQHRRAHTLRPTWN
ncbi:MAG: HPF/RaiA family ribosome-associated protein [Gemmataceae bacterium]|nr:HPF/RaiA family ribosome-associated protein [Gemmataceae bacterium]